MTLFFAVSVTLVTAGTTLLIARAAMAPAGGFDAMALTMLATLAALGVIEHWFLVTPLPAERLWLWTPADRQNSDAAGSDQRVRQRRGAPITMNAAAGKI